MGYRQPIYRKDPKHESSGNEPGAAPVSTIERDEIARISAYRRIVILTEGCSSPQTAKTAISLLRYRADDVVAVLDASQAGKTAEEVFLVGGDTPVIGSLTELFEADALFLGIAPAGGRLPAAWHPILLEANDGGLDIVSGLHDFQCHDDELVQAARDAGVHLLDVRRNHEKRVATAVNFNPRCLRILTVGQDCSVGKMTVSLEIERGLRTLGHDAQFVATGQTGIMLRGSGVPIDCVVADFISGAAEQLVVANQHHDIVLVEGQGSITHPSFSGVTLGLLHGSAPQGLVLCYEAGRPATKHLDHVPLTPLAELRTLYESTAAIRYPSKVIGVAMNSRRLTPAEANLERDRVEAELMLPVCDVFRHGPVALVEAVLDLKRLVLSQISNDEPATRLREALA